MNERTTISLPAELLARATRQAANEGRSLNDLIEEALRKAVQEKNERPRGPLPVSKATGGTLPGIDISNSAALQEMEDIEYIERLNRGFK